MSLSFRSLVCTVESDSHIWNLVYLQKLLEEHGSTVRNLGCCTPISDVLRAVAEDRPDLLVVSSVNGHGYHGVRLLLSALRSEGLGLPCVVGGKLTTAEADNGRVGRDLLARGCVAAFTGDDAVPRFREFLRFGMSVGFPAWHPPGSTPWGTPEAAETGVLSCV